MVKQSNHHNRFGFWWVWMELIVQCGEMICGFSTTWQRVIRFHDEHDRFPLVEFKKIPNISNARWNSRALLAILAFILMPDARNRLRRVCLFICTTWADIWFSDQKFRVADFTELEKALVPYQASLGCLKRHWKQEPSKSDIPRSNQCCERAIKVMQEIHASCKDKSNVLLHSSLLTNIDNNFVSFSGLFHSFFTVIMYFVPMLLKRILPLVVLWLNRF